MLHVYPLPRVTCVSMCEMRVDFLGRVMWMYPLATRTRSENDCNEAVSLVM